MDCSKTEVFFKEWRRMCDTFPVGKGDSCPLKMKGVVRLCCNCRSNVYEKTEKTIKIVQEWSDTHPIKTRKSVLLEAFPNAPMRIDGKTPIVCAGEIYGTFGCFYDADGNLDCAKCWNTPIEGEAE